MHWSHFERVVHLVVDVGCRISDSSIREAPILCCQACCRPFMRAYCLTAIYYVKIGLLFRPCLCTAGELIVGLVTSYRAHNCRTVASVPPQTLSFTQYPLQPQPCERKNTVNRKQTVRPNRTYVLVHHRLKLIFVKSSISFIFFAFNTSWSSLYRFCWRQTLHVGSHSKVYFLAPRHSLPWSPVRLV